MATVSFRLTEDTARRIAHVMELAAAGEPLTDDDRRVFANFAITLKMLHPEPRTLPLTPQQHELLKYLHEYITQHGYAPNFQEIADRFGYRSGGTVHEHLGNLEAKGWIRREFNEARSIKILHLTDDLQPAPSLRAV